MLKQRNEQIQFMIRIGDAIICVLAFFLAFNIRFSPTIFDFFDEYPTDPRLTYWILATSLALHFIIYPVFGFYTSLRLKSLPQIVSMVIRALVTETFILGSLVFFLQAKTTSRWFFVLFLAINYGAVLLQRLTARALLFSIRKRGYNFRQVLVVGTGSNAELIIDVLRRNRSWGYILQGILIPEGESLPPDQKDVSGVPLLGPLKDLRSIAEEKTVDEVIFAPQTVNPDLLSPYFSLCETLGLPARLSLGFFSLKQSKVAFMELDRIPVVTFYTTLMTPFEAYLKRLIDIVVSLIGLMITAFLFPWISYRIKKESPGPVIFKQKRVGENGRRFHCYKFRTMYLDAEERKAQLQAHNKMKGPLFKIENDPRIFPFGNFLRKTSLDELPQFLNILRGDMSVVGTRPPTPDEVQQYEPHFRRRLSIRPGLTGLWQISGRNKIESFEDVLALDLRYIDRWSIWLDIKIIFKTIWTTLFRHGSM